MNMFDPMPLDKRPTQPVPAVFGQDAVTHEVQPLDKRPTQQFPAVLRRDILTDKLKPLDEQPTQRTRTVLRRDSLTRKPFRPVVTKKRGYWLLYGCSFVLILLVISGVLWGPIVYQRVFLSSKPISASNFSNALHPQTSIVHSSDVEKITQQFMAAMLQKNWHAMWLLLASDAQKLWQDEGDFTHFEEAKFGRLQLQGFVLGQTFINHPWLNPDNTQVYPSAVTLQVALTASAPSGLLTDPSNTALKQGLFQHTLFALTQNGQQTWQVLIAGPADLEAPVLVPAHASVTRVILPIFMYHHISSQPTRNLFDFNLTVTVDNFNKQLDWLRQQGYQSITMTELFGAFYDGKKLPTKPVILTFDDGYADAYTYALPALLAHHYRGVFYIITGIIGGRYVTWDQVRSLARAGMEVGAHTIHHASLDEFPYTQFKTTPQMEIGDSKATLETQLGIPIQFFCYPSGEPFHHGSQFARQMVLKDLFEDGYLGATLDPATFNSALQNSEIPYQMPRIRVSGGENLRSFIGILKATLLDDAARLARL